MGVVIVASRIGRALLGKPRTLRSLWAGAPILNMAMNARAERLLGVRAESLVYETYYITNAFTYDLSSWMKLPGFRGVIPYLVLGWAALRYRRFHFYCDRGLLTPRAPYRFVEDELRLLRTLGAEIFFWTYGADVRTTKRTQSLGTPHCCLHCPAPGKACICDDADGRAQYEMIRRYASEIFSMGDMIEYTPGSTTDLFFWPVDLAADGGRRYRPRYPAPDNHRPLRVVHAANHQPFKGTGYLIDAVEQLEAEGVPIELDLVERVPNAEALERYRAADVIFDQCLIGFHGYFAQEAMALGKPVMCFIRRPEAYLLAPEKCPIINTRPEEIARTLRDLARNRAQLGEIGRRGRSYIERYHTLERFAQRLQRAYERVGAARP